ncbi:MAG TPA: M20/M25/M40 family metallo-hydrolase [Gemmatimonadaceae bacterium]|jgi:hypothetical protein|nr:M20/M25/M40 family metallo-hydrolase [Gemmatimonadaceae bacterium]
MAQSVFRLVAAGAVALGAIATPARAQRAAPAPDPYRTAMERADQQIADEVRAHSQLMQNLEYLTTQIGARLTGSPQMQAASAWTLQRFHDYGVDAHLETTEVPHAWTRGADDAEITAPITRRIGIRSMGWSKATDGAVSGPVVVVDASSPEDLAKYEGKLKGAIVLMGKPTPLNWVGDSAASAYEAVIPFPKGVPAQNGGGFAVMQQLNAMIAKEGPAAVLRDSRKPDNLFNMGGAGRYEPSAFPSAFLTHEDYSLIYRLTQRGPVTMRVDLKGTFSPGPVPASITVAEIKGSEHPDERVIIGGHLDSWDLGQGAVDNGTGAMAVLEAARTLKALGWTPKRTITFVLFTGEEEGGVGVQTFIKNHQAELGKISAVLIHDTGTGKVLSISMEDFWNTGPMFQESYTPLQEVYGLETPSTRFYGSSDHVAFQRAGIPGYFCVQAPAHYGEAHHSQTDTFDKVIPDQINQGAAVLASWAWNVASLPDLMPRLPVAAGR